MASNQGIPPHWGGPVWPGLRQPPVPPIPSFSDEMLRLIPDGIAIFDRRLSLRMANPAFCRMFDVTRYDLLGQHSLMLTYVVFGGIKRTLADALLGLPDDGTEFECEKFTLGDTGSQPADSYHLRAVAWRPNPLEESCIILWARQTNASRSETVEVTTKKQDGEQQIDDLLKALKLVTDLDTLCEEILGMALETAGGVSGSLMLVEEEGSHLVMAASRSIDERSGENTKQRIGEGIAGKVAATGQSLLLTGRVGDERFQGIGGRPGIRSSICTPIKLEKKTIGVLSVNSSQEGRPFSETEYGKVCNLADRISVVLDHSLRFRHIRRRLSELSLRAEIEAVAQSETRLHERLGQIADRCKKILDVDTFMIYLLDKDRKRLKLQAASGSSVQSAPNVVVEVGAGLVGAAAGENRVIVLQGGWWENDGKKYSRLFSAGVPVLHGGDSVGVIAIEKRCAGERDIEAVEIVESVASSIGHLIRDTLNQDNSKRRLTALSALSELSVAITNSEDRLGLAKLVAYTAATVLEQDVAMVRLLRRHADGRELTIEDTELLAVHGRSFPGDGDPILKIEARLAEEAIRLHKPCVSDDLPPPETAPLLQNSQLERVYSIPIQIDERILGFITTGSASTESHPRPVDREHALEIGGRLGDYASAVAQRFLTSGGRT